MGLKEQPDNDSYIVDSISLPDIFSKYNLIRNKGYLIKLDCEGGEHSLIGDKESEDILSEANQVSMEVHFRSKATPFEWWPEWKTVDEWIRSVFGYHHVDYYASNKRRGFGHYCIVRK